MRLAGNPQRLWLLLALCAAGAALLLLLLPGGSGSAARRGRAKLDGLESTEDLTRMNDVAAARLGSDTPGEFAAAVHERDRLAHSAAVTSIPGAGGTWSEYGHGPLIGDDPNYPTTLGDGFAKMEGRINDFAYAPQTGKLYAAVAQGGLWESTDLGAHWRPIGDNLPFQSTGAVGWTPAGGGTLIVATGDMAFSNDYAGVGTYWSTDDGKNWHKSAGAPDGALSFRVAVDPTNPNIVYLATGLGLYRSTDAGRNFSNVSLPTGDCTGNSFRRDCFFANVVTDVAVQAPDKFGHNGGAVVAALGWRDGQELNFDGKPEAPANGLYRSDTGLPGSFTKVPDSSGFTPTDHAGRIALGTTTGDGQNSNYLYAVSQDSQLFQKTVGGENDIPLVGTPSVLDAIYVSPDFGKTWTKMESRDEFFDPTNGSSLSQLTALGIGPGYQVTYNEFIKPDPTQSVGGIPSRVILGMEEVWSTVTPTPQNGHTRFQVIGSYTANGGACLAVPEACGAKQSVAGYTTPHPDQHGVAMIPDGKGGVTLIVGNDGGAYSQHADSGQQFSQTNWGEGANQGFETLLPYGGAMAKDGTYYAGMQDNGELKVLPNGEEHTVYVGDGIYGLVDPDHSNVAYDELPNGIINVSTDGGSSWGSMDPLLTDGSFVAPFLMDPTNANHLIAAGRNIAETVSGPNTTSPCQPGDPTCTPLDTDWKYVYDLGTHSHPGDPNAQESAADAPNVAYAAAMNGDDVYVGFCGDCDPVKLHRPFHTGFATNVGGSQPPKRMTSDGWHITAARGLPNRIITGVAPDPSNARTVYVTLGASAARFFAPLGSLGDDTSAVGKGHVFKSTDAGESFKDITGDLPDVQATSILVHHGQLVVGTSLGVFISADTNGLRWAPAGNGLPAVAVYSLSLKPGDPGMLVAATFGRGIWSYRFAGSACRDTTAPRSKITKKGLAAAARRGGVRTIRGTSSDVGCGPKGRGKVKRVQVSVAQLHGKKHCRFLKANGRFGKTTKCRPAKYIRAKGTTKWSFKLRRRLPRGTYRVEVRAIDSAGNVERKARKPNFAVLRVR